MVARPIKAPPLRMRVKALREGCGAVHVLVWSLQARQSGLRGHPRINQLIW